ncbi:hypothetical protein SAMN05216227_102037 [Pseudorhodobacter antarcticus]|jgi:hypothetical protein|uniref:Uncharacterized protein n=1 Tax=Pseudorhodobacter antarcticus TaxID=1077947 RepID=A0A1H8IHB6_9RHOB|nr:hypothetical protein [Pseudorhodobacter antarcticus]SEN67655.1 hypothetical protein SAMN05216227_102037 [Pseudorhodobacter antarcticus]
MAKGAATEQRLGILHAKVADVFSKVLQRYEDRLDALDAIPSMADVSEEVLTELMTDAAMPNPAMLAAITKFLKDNTISFDSEQLAELSSQERRLQERKANRPAMATLTKLAVVSNG